MLTKSALSSQHWFHSLVVSITSLILCFSATGGVLIPALLLAVPLAIVFAISGYVGGLLALCASLGGITGVYALMNLISTQASIPPALTYVAVSLGAIAIAVGWRHSLSDSMSDKLLKALPLALVPLAIALVSGYVVFRWTKVSDLEFLNALAGSEDNAAWISGTRTFLSGEMTTDYLAHPTAKSPVTGTALGFVSDVYWIAQSDTPGHLLALRALRSAYALIIVLSAMAAAAWVSVVAARAKVSSWFGFVASLMVAVAVLGSSLFLFTGVGFFSFINGILFAFVAVLGLEVAYFGPALTWRAEGILLLVLAGSAGAWWGVAPLAAVLIVVVATTPSIGNRFGGQSRLDRIQYLGAWLFSLSTLLWTWDVSMGRRIEVGQIGATGTVPIVETAWFPIIFLVVAVLVVRAADHFDEWRRRAFHLLLAWYVALIWLLSMLEYAEPRYAAYKILVLLSLLTMVGLGVVLVERAPRFGHEAALAGLALVLLWSSVVHESHNGIRGLGRIEANNSAAVQSRILETLNDNPQTKIVCLHQDPDLRISAYLCSRLAASFSPGPSQALNEWTGALLNSDISPNGIEMSREDHVGSRVLTRFRNELAEQDVVVILIGGNSAEGVTKDLGPDFWWVQELNWAEIQTVRL